MLEYFSEAGAVDFLERVLKLLKPGGSILVAEADFHSFGRLEAMHRWLNSWITSASIGKTIHYRSTRTSLDALQAAGFVAVELMPYRYVVRLGIASAYLVEAQAPKPNDLAASQAA